MCKGRFTLPRFCTAAGTGRVIGDVTAALLVGPVRTVTSKFFNIGRANGRGGGRMSNVQYSISGFCSFINLITIINTLNSYYSNNISVNACYTSFNGRMSRDFDRL